MAQLWQEYVRWHVLRVFFEDYRAWIGLCQTMGLPGALDIQEYEAVLYGTRADVYIPLWASVCKRPGAALLDATTRDVIACYKKMGYQPIRMDGNPPDYVGEQCRFLEYLSVCALKGRDTAGEASAFVTEYLSETVHEMRKAAGGCEAPEAFCWVLRQAADGVCGKPWPYGEPAWREFDSFSWEPLPPIPLEKPYTTTQASFCDCGRKCKMIAVIQEGCVLSIGPDEQFPHKKFTGCARGRQYRQTFLSPHRLRYPMLRAGERGEGRFRRISWEEAEAWTARAIRATQRTWGPGSRYVMPGSGVGALVRGDRFMKDLLALTGGYLNYYNYYSAACAEHALPYVYGTDVCGSSEEELWKTKLLILWGHNPANTIWGDAFLPNLAKAKAKGVRIVVIDPRQSETALQYADQWIGIRPSTDGALCDAMAYEIWSRGLQDQVFMDRFCIGFDEDHMPEGVAGGESYQEYLFGRKDGVIKNAEWAQEITGIPAETIRQLAIEYAVTKPAWLLPGLGPQRTLNGEQNCRGFAMLAALTGNVGKPGGGSGGYLNRHGHQVPGYKLAENPYPGQIPSFLWPRAADGWETFQASDGLRGVPKLDTGIKMIFSLASGMLAGQHSNINETVRLLTAPDKVEYLIVSDLFMTPGARYADLLLPGVSFFETENVVPPWNASDYLLFNQQAIAPLFGGRFEYEWARGTAALLGQADALCKGRDIRQWLEALYDAHRALEPELPDYGTFRRLGCYVYRDSPYEIAFQEQIEKGVPFATPSGKIEIFSKRLFDRQQPDLPGIPCYTPCAEGAQDPLREKYPLQLIGYHTNRRCHSIHDNNPQLDELEGPALWLNPEDAAPRGIQSGALVDVFNDRGCIRIPAKVTRRIVPGCVALSEGGWYTPDKNGVDRRGSINVLTMTHKATPLAKANPQHTNLVQAARSSACIGSDDGPGANQNSSKSQHFFGHPAQ